MKQDSPGLGVDRVKQEIIRCCLVLVQRPGLTQEPAGNSCHSGHVRFHTSSNWTSGLFRRQNNRFHFVACGKASHSGAIFGKSELGLGVPRPGLSLVKSSAVRRPSPLSRAGHLRLLSDSRALGEMTTPRAFQQAVDFVKASAVSHSFWCS